MPTKTKSTVPARRRKSNDFSRELQWVREHREEYLGQWVALDGDRVVARGSKAKEVYETAVRKGVSAPFLAHLTPLEASPTIGGW